jgi:myo-inositol-1(or 4)-monophosphatase
MNPTLSDIEMLARQAGKIIRAQYNPLPSAGNHLQIDYKGEIDPVTDVDRRSEAFILEEIRSRFPHDQVITEESGQIQGRDCCIWYIDPLDGTVNYAHGLPIFAVSIAYQRDGDLRLGVVYDPIHDECFCAERGKGAWLNGQPLHVSSIRDIDRSLLVTGFPYDIRTNPENNLDYHARLSLISQGVRRLGSAALDLCYVAAGRLDGFWEIRTAPWDVAAGGLIAQEAGAVVTNADGEPDFLSMPNSILAANPHLHPQILDALKNGI